jgi:hypothetical protein
MRLQALRGRHRGTIWRVLRRHGVSRRRRGQRQTYRRFEWSQPGALLHIDAYSAPKFLEPGHRVTGDRDKNDRARNLGKTVVIAVQDDHSRIVYAELHWAENAANVSITLKRAAVWMREQGCGPLEAVMSDNAKCYTGRLFPTHPRRARRSPHPHPALHAALERQARAFLGHPRRRMGPQPRLAQLRHPRPRHVIVPALLQPPAPTQRRQRPTTHHPHPATPRAGQLVHLPGARAGQRPTYCRLLTDNRATGVAVRGKASGLGSMAEAPIGVSRRAQGRGQACNRASAVGDALDGSRRSLVAALQRGGGLSLTERSVG